MVEELCEMDIKNKKLGHVIATSPQLLLRKPQEFLQVGSEEVLQKSLNILKDLFISLCCV